MGKSVNNTKVRRTQQERKAESERRILRAAVELFAKQGYMKTTLSEIGKAAGHTGGLVSHRFGTKEQLLMAVIQNSAGSFLRDQLRPAIEGEHIQSAETALRNYIETYFNQGFSHESHFRALYVIMGEALGSVPEVRPQIAQLNREMRKSIRTIVERGIEAGEFAQNINPHSSALLIVGLLRGVVMQYLADPKAFKKKEMLPILQDSAVAALKITSR